MTLDAGRWPRRPLAALALATLLLGSCRGCGRGEQTAAKPQQRNPQDLPTEEVAPPPDAKVDVSRDVQERRRAESFAGVLPTDFPKGLPLPPQASLVDQGGKGGAWVDLLVPRRPEAVRDPYLQQLRGGGWKVTAAGADAWSLHRGKSAVRLQVRAQGPSTRLRLSY